MLDFAGSLPFLIIVGVFALFLVIGIAKRAVRLLVWVIGIFVVLVLLGMVEELNMLGWFENLSKILE